MAFFYLFAKNKKQKQNYRFYSFKNLNTLVYLTGKISSIWINQKLTKITIKAYNKQTFTMQLLTTSQKKKLTLTLTIESETTLQ